MMAPAGHKEHRLADAGVEDGGDDGEVGQVTAPGRWVVAEDHVSLLQALLKMSQLQRCVHHGSTGCQVSD